MSKRKEFKKKSMRRKHFKRNKDKVDEECLVGHRRSKLNLRKKGSRKRVVSILNQVLLGSIGRRRFKKPELT
tara:strand:- start:2005 stop:2220 length:216 start_codon:yes stop_codon:yes gene_type:complete